MERDHVDAVVVTPPCDQFSQWQDLSRDESDPEIKAQRLRGAIKLLRFGLRVVRWALDSGRLALLEHPAGASSWSLWDTLRLLDDPRFIEVVGRQMRSWSQN